jgi:hypothetical protein
MLDKLKQKSEQIGEFVSVAEIPNEVVAKLENGEFKVDKRGNECLFVRLRTKDNKIIIQKYTPSTYKTLYERIKACGDIEALKNEYFTWKKERVGRAINERLFPYPLKKKVSTG